METSPSQRPENASRHCSFNLRQRKPVRATEVKLKAGTNAEKCRAYRARIKMDKKRFAMYKSQQRARSKIRREAMTAEQRQRNNELARIRNARRRERKKGHGPSLSDMSSTANRKKGSRQQRDTKKDQQVSELLIVDCEEVMDSPDWEPPTEAEMKLIQARRERSDKISKLMSSYLLKGYKMLGIVCATCDTILLQDRQGNNYCVACSELDTDTDKDDPVTNQSAALSMASEIELSSAGTATAHSDSRGAGGATATKVTASPATPHTLQSRTGHETVRVELNGDGTQILSMSSIDVQSWPSDPGAGQGDLAAAAASELSIKLETVNSGGDSDSGLHSLSGENNLSPPSHRGRCQANAQQQTSRSSLSSSSLVSSSCISNLCEKITWASKELKSTPSVEYSIQLCTLIKTAAEAVTAVRNARI